MPINSFISITGDCQSTSSGASKIIFTDGTPPYTANWISPSLGTDLSITSTTRTNLSAGTYVVLINDSSAPVNESIYVNVEISSGVCVSSEVVNTTCGDDNGQITVSATTNASFTEYILYSSDTFVSSGITNTGYQTFLNLTAGTYQVVVKDIGGCTANTETLIIQDSNNIDYGLYVIGDTSCYGPTGKIFITGCTGPGPFTYLWSNGETTQSITGLTAGTYSVTVSNNEGCSVTKEGTVLTIPPPYIADVTSIPPDCFNANGQITIQVTGGTEPFYYSGSNGYSIISYSRFFTLTGLTSGTYEIAVTDCSLCKTSTFATVQGVNTFNVISIVTDNSYCGNKDGSITATVQGGSPLYKYTLIDTSGNTKNWSTNSTQYTFDNLDSGEYTIYIEDNSGCVFSEVLYILTENKFSISAVTSGTTCGNNNGSVYISLSTGGTPTYNYTLSNGGFLNNTSLTSTTFNNLSVGQYTATVTDSTNCKQTISFYISAATQPLFFNLVSVGNSINTLITSGEPPFILDWSENVNGQTGLNLTGLTAGTYSLTITDSNGCLLTRTIDLTNPTPFVSYELFNICTSPFEITTNTKRGILQMTWDGFSDITGDDFGCILNQTIFTTKITVSGSVYQHSFYTGTTLNDVPTDDQWKNSVAYLLNQIPGVGSFNIDILNNVITIKTECDENLLGGENLKIELKVEYDISCQATPTPSATPTPTPTPSVTTSPTPSPTSSTSPTPTATVTNTGPTPTPSNSPTPSATPTSSPTPSPTPSPTATEFTCLIYSVYSSGNGSWYGTPCGDGAASGYIPNNTTISTSCLVVGSLQLNNAIIVGTQSCIGPSPTPTSTQTATPTPEPTPEPTPTETINNCSNYQITPVGSISIEWFGCGGSYNTATFFFPTNICAETGTIVQTGGSGSIVFTAFCTS